MECLKDLEKKSFVGVLARAVKKGFKMNKKTGKKKKKMSNATKLLGGGLLGAEAVSRTALSSNRAINTTKKGIKMKNGLSSIEKTGASSGSARNIGEVAKGIGIGAGATAAGALALKGVSSLSDYAKERSERKKFESVMDHAKKKHPELRRVPKEEMENWMDAFHTLSPKMSTNKEIGSSMLATANDYGGNIDLATAKLIAETGSKTEGRNSGDDEVLALVNGGRALGTTSILED